MKIIVSPGSVVLTNPFFQRFITEMEALGNEIVSPSLQHLTSVNVFHTHYPEHQISVNKSLLKALMMAPAMLGFMFAIRLKGGRIVWMVHDVVPMFGYRPRLQRVYMSLVKKAMSGYIFLSKSSRIEFERIHPEQRTKPMLDAFHPPYAVKLLKSEEKISIREKLGVKPDEFVIGYLGNIRPYKNPEILRRIPELLDDGRKTVILVAGKPDQGAKDYEKYFVNRRHIYLDKWFSDREMESLIQAVDIVLLPYAWGWNSGFLLLVLSCHQKCLASNLPIFQEMWENFGCPWITTFDLAAADQRSEMKHAINEVSKITCSDADTERLTQRLEEISYPRMAAKVQSFYISLNCR